MVSVGGRKETDSKGLAHPRPPVLSSTSSAREGPDLDGPGKERQERERLRVDSESLDDEDS